jgi:predicted acetyltransferase
MSEIRLMAEAELAPYAQMMIEAYPGIFRTQDTLLEDFQKRWAQPHIHFLGLFENGKLLGAMQHIDFEMTVRDQPVPIGGLAGVAVDLLHKKQRVAYHLVQHYLRRCREEGQPIALLYPFRPDFYRKMGFGYGMQANQYRVATAAFPQLATVEHLRFATEDDREAMLACYSRYAATTHGMIRRQEGDFDRFFMDESLHTLLYAEGDRVLGYLIYQFRPGEAQHAFDNDLHVRELLYETPQVLAELFTFLHRQLDQATRVYITTQDEYFMYLLDDPRDGAKRLHQTNTQAISWMSRVVDAPALFNALAGHDFHGETLRLRIELADDFLPENASDTVVWFEQGKAAIVPGSESDATIRLHVREFSSLLMGVVNFKWLVSTGLAIIDQPTLTESVNRLFHWDRKPICMTFF